MTERSYQECRKVMQQINYQRGLISKQKGEVAKWTAIEDTFTRQMQPGRAAGANRCLLNAIKKLDELRNKFANIKFPDSDLPNLPKQTIVDESPY